MFRDVASKVAWVGRTASMVFGLALVLALLLGIATMALAAVPGDPFKLGQMNRIDDAVTTLIGSHSGPMMVVDNDSEAQAARALDLRVEPNRAPMRVNSDSRVTNLNADKLDGQEAGDLAEPRGYAHVKLAGDVDPDYPSRGVNDVVTPTGKPNVYCFDLTFAPNAAVGSPHPNNNAVVATWTQTNASASDSVDVECDPPHDDAVARTFAADTGDPAAINFQIVFE